MPTGPIILGGGISPPDTLAEQPLDRAWSRRALASPPPWGRAMTYIWAETQVTFARATPADQAVANDFGVFTRPDAGPPAGQPTTYLTAMCHVELEQKNRPTSISDDEGPSQVRYWTIYMDVPRDVSRWPHKGDVVTFNPRQPGGIRTLPIRYVHSPDELGDHFECEVWETE